MLETLLHKGDTEERCGLLLKDGTVIDIPNVAEDPKTSFEMDLEIALPYLDAENVAATWHTHPESDPNLSGEDYSCFLSWPDLEHVIIGVRDGQTAIRRYRVEQGLVIECDSIFHGELRKKFGRSFDIQANSIAEALEGFSRQVDWPRDMPVQVLGHRSDASLLECPNEAHIVPALRGGSGKFFNIILGAVLVVAGILIGGPLGVNLIINGAIMIVSGIVQLFMKAPKYNKSNDPEASKYVSVNRNTTAIGTPMTMAWGRIDLGGHWLSLQSDSNQLSYGVFPATPT